MSTTTTATTLVSKLYKTCAWGSHSRCAGTFANYSACSCKCHKPVVKRTRKASKPVVVDCPVPSVAKPTRKARKVAQPIAADMPAPTLARKDRPALSSAGKGRYNVVLGNAKLYGPATWDAAKTFIAGYVAAHAA